METLVLSCTVSETECIKGFLKRYALYKFTFYLLTYLLLQVFVFMTPPLFHPIFGVFLLDQIADVGVNLSRYLKLFGREIIFEVFQPV